MKRPLIYSAALHLTVLFLIIVGFYNPFQSYKPAETPVMIEFVNIAEQSAAPVIAPEVIKEAEQPLPPQPTPTPAPPEPAKPEPQPEPEPQPQLEPEPVKPEPPKPEPKPEELTPKEAEPIPDPKTKKEKPKEKPKEEKKKQKAELTLAKTKKPDSKTDDKKPDQKKKKPSKSFDDLLKDIEKSENGSPSSGKGAPASTIGPVLTASEKDALSSHMAKCWLIPAGLRDARNIRVPIKINVSRDGVVQKAEIQDKSRMASDAAYRTAAESARRAVLDPNCSPLPIPPNKYEIFKEFVFNFDPKEMF